MTGVHRLLTRPCWSARVRGATTIRSWRVSTATPP